MKKYLLFLFLTSLLCGCSNVQKLPHDDCDFLIDANWEGNDTQCVNVIKFKEDGGFSNWCYCGSPVGYGDICESFRYSSKDRTIFLLDDKKEIIETGKVLYVDDLYLIVDLWGRCYVYENLDMECPKPHLCALEYTKTEEMTKPCLTVLGYENGMLTVSSYDYDGDAASDFEVWTLPVSEDFSCSTVSVTVENDVVSLETAELTESDYAYLGEYYTGGYIEMNRDGEVSNIVFYGELIIW